MLALDGQVQVGGLLTGPGTPYAWESFNPWDSPDLSTNDLNRAQRHGVIAGRDLLRARRITGILHVVTESKQAAIDAFHALVGAWQPQQTDVTMLFRAGTRTYRAYGRPRLVAGNPRFIRGGVMRVECRFHATDPFLYDDVEQNDTETFPNPSDLFFDEYTEMWLDPLTDGRMPINNEGNVGAPWVAEITGPWETPTVQVFDPEGGDYPPVLGQLSVPITLEDGQALLIDSKREHLYLDGSLDLSLSTINVAWFTIPPGEMAMRVTGESGTGTAEIWTRSTWL